MGFSRSKTLFAPSGGCAQHKRQSRRMLHAVFELVLEAVRQVRGTSTNQVKRNDVAMVIGGPMVTPVSNLLLGSDATL
jgi:hypothetical protein